MGNFDLDLQAAEGELDEDDEDEYRIVLDVLDGSTPPEERISAIREGVVLVLSIDGELNELATDFAREIKDMGGHLVHFRGFLIVTPSGIHVDTDRLD